MGIVTAGDLGFKPPLLCHGAWLGGGMNGNGAKAG
jgi:hypothetical protein